MAENRCPKCGSSALKRGGQNLWCAGCGFFPVQYSQSDITSVTGCKNCPFRNRPKVGPEGDPETCRYFLIGEAPAWDEVRKGRPFVGATGRLLMAFLERAGISRDECFITNAVLCQLPSDKKGLTEAIKCCRPRLLDELAQVNTGATVWVMGGIARDALYPGEKGGILASRGWRTFDGRDAYVSAHPAYYLYNPNDAPMFQKDIKRLKRGRQHVIQKFEVARAIPLTKGKYTWVSDEDYSFLRQWTWYATATGYACTGGTWKHPPKRMHRVILERMGLNKADSECDHITGKRLDNRRSNLRTATHSQNLANQQKQCRATSSNFRGVSWAVGVNKTNPWVAYLNKAGKHFHLGYFATEEEAARAFDAGAKKHYGEYARLNFPEPKLEWTAWVLDTKELLEEFIASLHRKPLEERGYIALDLETDQVDHQRDRILGMSVSPEYGRALIIPDSLLYQDGMEWVTTSWSKHKRERFLSDPRYRTGSYLRPNPNTVALLRELFAIMGYKWVMHNSKFDMRFLRHLGVENVHCDFDTIIAHYTQDERKGGHSLKALGDDYYDVGDYEAELFNYIAKKSGRYSKIPRGVLYRYNATDTELTLRLAYTLEKELKKQGLYEKPFLFPMQAAIPMLLEAELCGVNINWPEMERIDSEEIEPELQKVAAELREISGHPNLNPLSSVRVNDILYDEMNFPIIEVRTRAAGKRLKKRSSQIAVMDGWKKLWEQGKLPVTKRAWHFATRLRYYRHVRKMRGSYVRKWQTFRGTDDRVHASFLLRGTVTGRLSARDPAVQTIPSKVQDKWGPLIANTHIPKPGWKLLYADFSQAELMAAACISGDEFMLETFRKEDVDYHNEVALAAFGPNYTRDDRQASKKLTFGWLYGGDVYEIALDALQFEGAVAERFAHEWDDLFAGLVAWRKAQGELIQKQGYVESIFGRRRRFPLLTSRNVGKAKRIAINAPIQSAVSDLNLVSATKLYERFKSTDYATVILLIHDSTVMEVRDDHVEGVREAMRKIMLETAAEYFPQVPFRADVKIGTRLGDLT